MAEIIRFPESARKGPTAQELAEKVRGLLERDSGNMKFEHPHFQERLEKRNVSMRQVLDVIKNGEPVGGPKLDQWGDWRIKLYRKTAGRKVQVVVAVKENHFDLVTVI